MECSFSSMLENIGALFVLSLYDGLTAEVL